MRRWIGDTQIWRDIWAGAPNGIEAGGQLRRFGRYLFAQNVQRFEAAFLDRINARQTGGAVESRWTIHVVAGLAGGTGSGTLVDVVGQIRKLRPNRDETKIILYAVLPETDPTSWAKANYYANGYAALSEINGLLVKAYAPSDVASAVGRYESELPINNVFLITNRNENGLLMDMNTVTPDVVAETLFQLVVASGDARALNARDPNRGAGGADRIWRDTVTGENNQGEYERDAAAAPTLAPTASSRSGSSGSPSLTRRSASSRRWRSCGRRRSSSGPTTGRKAPATPRRRCASTRRRWCAAIRCGSAGRSPTAT